MCTKFVPSYIDVMSGRHNLILLFSSLSLCLALTRSLRRKFVCGFKSNQNKTSGNEMK